VIQKNRLRGSPAVPPRFPRGSPAVPPRFPRGSPADPVLNLSYKEARQPGALRTG